MALNSLYYRPMQECARQQALSASKKESIAVFLCHAASFAWKECSDLNAAIIIMEALKRASLEIELISPVDVAPLEKVIAVSAA